MNAERAAREIARAYGTYAGQYGQGQWMRLREVLNRVDMDHESLTKGVRYLLDTDPRFDFDAEANQKTLTQADRDAAVWIGGQWNHFIYWS